MQAVAESGSAPFSGVERLVLPGDDVTSVLTAVAESLRLGQGLCHHDEKVVVTKAGILSYRQPNRFFVLSSQARYVPAVGDTVVGVVVDRTSEAYRVRLHGTAVAMLPLLAFDGATKRNKPSINIGSIVFAQVSGAVRAFDPELSCTAISGPKKDWMTGQSMFGELKGGTLLQVSSGLARRLLDPSCALLSALGAAFPFEVAVGVNGLVWVAAASSRHTVAVTAAIEKAEHLDDAQCRALAASVVGQMNR